MFAEYYFVIEVFNFILLEVDRKLVWFPKKLDLQFYNSFHGTFIIIITIIIA